ncbi:MAG TPA: hypothetical protein VGD37_41615 [Kofleriaceae bacterium]|jgi:hypothetical protein
MRLRKLITPLALGLAVGAIIRHRRARRAAPAERLDDSAERLHDFAADPRDPVQGFDEIPELAVMPLDVDALSQADAEAADDLAGLEVDVDDTAERDAEGLAMGDLDEPSPLRDAGDLYGAHTPAAVDRVHPDGDRSFDTGQNWIEALETSAVENGAEPERELDDIVDDEDVLRPPHASHTRDTPIADLGSAGRRGL